jgi:glycosyltransferase involved in cell wall biosynthesis
MKEPISLSIFFPTYNEEENIEQTVEDAVRVAEESPYIADYEILVINDGSTDSTASIVRELEARYPAVRLISHNPNQGYGAALKTCLRSATKDYIFFTDADRQFDLVELQNLIMHVPTHDAVIGYRAPRRDPFMRLLNALGWNVLNRLAFGLQIRDIDCAFKLFRRDVIERITLQSSGAMINAELLIKLVRHGASIKQIPVSHLPRVAGSATGAKPAVILRALGEMAGLYAGELGMPSHKQAFKYMTVGILNTLLDITAYIGLTRMTPVFSEHIIAAKFFSFLLGTISSLMLNRWWTFGVRSKLTFAEVVRFYSVISISLGVNVASMRFLVHLGFQDLVALALTTGITLVVGFLLSKFWVFRADRKPLVPSETLSQVSS